ncbi:hypothetical protein LBMAG56_02410 [Verrucomicrobiota bacterium]|nr:hypothetical protein LBMAG56_02410 [Verrucomicrobiota bacterium]
MRKRTEGGGVEWNTARDRKKRREGKGKPTAVAGRRQHIRSDAREAAESGRGIWAKEWEGTMWGRAVPTPLRV